MTKQDNFTFVLRASTFVIQLVQVLWFHNGQYPEGVSSHSPGLAAQRPTLGQRVIEQPTPKGLRHSGIPDDGTPLGYRLLFALSPG